MKVAFAENNVVGSKGLEQTTGFKITASAHAFKILSSGLYSDKVRAVLREIGCNAMDAHIVAGDPNKPFRVKLPNTLDDQFYIQDWGPGLSHEKVMGLYTNYFSSTKQQSDELTGAFGLGSKSPFSYTDSFNVVSTHGGKKRTYSLYIGNMGAPQVSLMAEEEPDSDWAHGIRVGMAVKPQDFVEFESKAREVFKWFRVAPEMRGSANIKPVKYRFECDDFGLLKETEDAKTIVALMGNVAYPVGAVNLGIVDVNNAVAARDLINYASTVPGLVLFLPIGAVQVAASREQLQYDPESIKVLKEAVRLAIARMGKDVVTKLEKVANAGTWQDLCAANGIVENYVQGLRYHFAEFAEAIGVDKAAIPKLKQFLGTTYVKLPNDVGLNTSCFIVKRSAGRVQVRSRDLHDGRQLDITPKTAIFAGLADRGQSRCKRAIADGIFDQILFLGKGSRVKPTQKTVELEAQLAHDQMFGLEVKDVGAYPPIDLPAGSQRKKKKKGWVPSLPIGIKFPCYIKTAEVAAELNAIDPLFMCKVSKTRWSSTTDYARLFKTTAEQDKTIDWNTWKFTWDSYIALQGGVMLPNAPKSYAILSAGQIKSIALPQLGWELAWDGIIKYLQRPELQVALLSKVKKKHLLAPTHVHQSTGWMSGLAWWLGSGDLSASSKGLLRKHGLMPQLEAMILARQEAAKKGTELDVPKVVEQYQGLCARLGVENAVAKDVAKALTVEDLDAVFANRFPRAGLLKIEVALNSYLKQDALEYILSKEK